MEALTISAEEKDVERLPASPEEKDAEPKVVPPMPTDPEEWKAEFDKDRAMTKRFAEGQRARKSSAQAPPLLERTDTRRHERNPTL